MKMRSTVSVREGQGVVLLCGTPPRAGGKEHWELPETVGEGGMSRGHSRRVAGSSIREQQ